MPTKALTLMAVDSTTPIETEERHCSAVADVHADVEHAPRLASEPVTVASTVPKLRPKIVVVTNPERAKFAVCAFVSAGASNERAEDVSVPTIAATVTCTSALQPVCSDV